jgi:DNA repair exonuclease SbcCD ATPase subunit
VKVSDRALQQAEERRAEKLSSASKHPLHHRPTSSGPLPSCSNAGRPSDSELLDFIASTQNGQDYNGHLETFSHGLQIKLREMMDLCQRLDNLRQSAQELLATSQEEDQRAASDLAARVAKLEGSRDKVALIDGLRGRLQAEREKVSEFHKRLDKVQSTIDAQKDREEAAKRRVSCV